jgi:hypothetical protein
MKIFLKSLAVILLIVAAGCEKSAESPDIASLIVGSYEGDGTDSNGTDFQDQTIVVSKISNTRIRVAPAAGNSFTTEFETSISSQKDNSGAVFIVSKITSGVSLVVDTSQNPMVIGYINFNNDEEFNGSKLP